MAETPVLRVVFTGGPGGGKTTLIDELLAQKDRPPGWLAVPEAAPLLFRAGLDAAQKSFQLKVVRTQIGLEEARLEAAGPDGTLLCHRGTLDSLAYWLRNGWDEEEFVALTAMSREDHQRRYHAVIHLQTAAIGATRHYRRFPDSHRPETPEQASEIDRLCAAAWGAHPGYVLVANGRRDWHAKSRVARECLESCLRETCTRRPATAT